MITLPKDWRDSIQFREFMQPVNEFGEVGILVLILVNEDKQVWAYEKSVHVSKTLKDEEMEAAKKIALKKAYDVMVYMLPSVAVQQETAQDFSKDNYEEYADITNDKWKALYDKSLKLYKDIK